ncbi:MAG: DNA starvation/stationary phase protection protein Dps [Pirellula sp.]|nr:DNA starvation/stationary phase protection protein Dps [Pirellula sp.]
MKLNPTKNDLSAEVRTKAVTLLQARLADCTDLQSQTKQAHWNVKGPDFIALHKLFDEIYEDVGDYVDEIAERGVQLGGTMYGTVRATAAKTSLPEYPLEIKSCRDHAAALSTALATFGKLARAAIDESTQFGDADTADLFTGISRGIDKWVWMVEAHLQND